MPPAQSAHNHNLPASVSSFIGRDQELHALHQRLRETRLLTLIGPGGIGKTRLALRAAAAALDQFPDGVWLVELADVDAADRVADRIATALTLPDTSESVPLERLAMFLEHRHLLLLLDNCEHLITECARVAAVLLARAPRLGLLATSREPLVLGGEVVVRVPALSLPEPGWSVAGTHALHSDAVHLFVERAHAAEPAFQLTANTMPAVVEICRRLDGLPLALELAAGQVRGLGVAGVAARLDQRFTLLVGGDRSALPRQQTLQATIDWSYRLLPATEQAVLRQLGIFAGEFSAEAADYVCAAPATDRSGRAPGTSESVLQHLVHLVNTSLVQCTLDTGRYRLLETIRLFARERLAEADGAQAAGDRHLAWYLHLAESAAPHLSGPEQAGWAMRLEAEHDNLRAALRWALDAGRAEDAARLALALWRFWHTHTYQREGLTWLEQIRVLDAADPLPSAVRPRLLNALGVLANSLLRFEQATAYQTEALRLWREQGDRAGMARALCDLGWRYFDDMRQDRARTYAAESLSLARAAGDQPATAAALFLQAVAVIEGELETAAAMRPPAEPGEPNAALEESVAIWRSVGDSGNMAKAMSLLGRAESLRGNHQRAGSLLREAVRLLVQVGNYIDLQAALVALHIMAMQAPQQPEGARLAAQVCGMMRARMERLGGRSPWNEGPFQQAIERLATMLGPEALGQALASGKHMPMADLIALADRITALTVQPPQSVPRAPTPAHATLTARELEVLRLVAAGLTNAQAAQQLHVAPRTINAHLTAIYAKLGVTSRGGAMRYAIDHQLG